MVTGIALLINRLPQHRRDGRARLLPGRPEQESRRTIVGTSCPRRSAAAKAYRSEVGRGSATDPITPGPPNAEVERTSLIWSLLKSNSLIFDQRRDVPLQRLVRRTGVL